MRGRELQLEIGRLLSASQLVVGSIGQIGGWLVVTVRLVDVPTGQTLGSVSEKYLCLEALIDALASLAQQTVQVAGRDVHAAEALTARSLVTSAGRVQLECKLQRLRRRVDEQLYARWLPEKGFAEYEQEAAIEESIEFLEEHLAQTNTWGHALDLVGSYVPFRARADEEEGRYTLAAGMLAGCGERILCDWAAKEHGVDVIFVHGFPPHGGFAIRLERLFQKVLGLANVKEACLFPRDRKRIRP